MFIVGFWRIAMVKKAKRVNVVTYTGDNKKYAPNKTTKKKNVSIIVYDSKARKYS